jgi:hypothetical protein
MTQDFLVTDQIGAWLFEPVTEGVLTFVREKVSVDAWMSHGQSFVVDYRDAGGLAEDLEDEGFTVTTRH